MKEREYKCNLKELLHERNMSAKELSDKTGIDPVSISRYANNCRYPKVNDCFKMSNVLNCSVEDLYNIDSNNDNQAFAMGIFIGNYGNNIDITICTRCGRMLPITGSANYCSSCGAKLKLAISRANLVFEKVDDWANDTKKR